MIDSCQTLIHSKQLRTSNRIWSKCKWHKPCRTNTKQLWCSNKWEWIHSWCSSSRIRNKWWEDRIHSWQTRCQCKVAIIHSTQWLVDSKIWWVDNRIWWEGSKIWWEDNNNSSIQVWMQVVVVDSLDSIFEL